MNDQTVTLTLSPEDAALVADALLRAGLLHRKWARKAERDGFELSARLSRKADADCTRLRKVIFRLVGQGV